MYKTLFYFLYSYYDNTKRKEEKIPFFSTICVLAVLQMANYVFIRDLIFFQFNGIKYKIFENENLIVPTIFIGLNYWYFKRSQLYKEIIKNFSDKKLELSSSVFCWTYIVLSIALAIVVGYSVRNNIFWFK